MNMLEFTMVLVTVSATALFCGIFIGHKIGALNMTGRDPFPEDQEHDPVMLDALDVIRIVATKPHHPNALKAIRKIASKEIEKSKEKRIYNQNQNNE